MMQIIINIAVMAGVTYLIRCLPIAVFKNKIKSRFIQSFLYYVPYAVLGGMTFPAIFYSTEHMTYSLIGTVVALILGYLEKGLTTVAVISVLAVYLCHYIR